MMNSSSMHTSRFKAYFELLRPPLAPMDLAMPAASALLASYAVSGALPPLLPFVIATIGAYCAITSSYVYNDCCDIDVDRVAMPDRPLPSARLNKRSAQVWSLLLFCIAAAVALYLNPSASQTGALRTAMPPEMFREIERKEFPQRLRPTEYLRLRRWWPFSGQLA